MKSQLIHNDIRQTSILKGIAILGVLLLHGLSSVRGMYLQMDTAIEVIFADQFLRFCVPLFVALSGFALASKYKESVETKEFLWRRVAKLIPQYVLWSLIFSFAIAPLYPQWGEPSVFIPFWQKLAYGKSDYHLYFVPMILQLYLLFPLLHMGMRKSRHVMLALLLGVQLAAYAVLSQGMVGVLITPDALQDQNHYLFFIHWIGYFGLGMWLAGGIRRSRVLWVTLVALVALIVGITFAVFGAQFAMRNGVDSIIALRTTRLPIYLLAGGTTVLMILYRKYTSVAGKKGSMILNWLGTTSYTIYLSHTLLFRILFSLYYGTENIVTVLPATLLLVFGLWLSRYL